MGNLCLINMMKNEILLK